MITESGRVVAVDGSNIWVQTIRQSACNSCKARQGCGQRALAGVTGGRANQVCVANALDARVGDEVTLAIKESALLGASVLAYALPLLLFVLGAIAGHLAGSGSEVASMVGALAGLAVGFGLSRFLNGRHESDYVPQLVNVQRASAPVPGHWEFEANPTDS